MMGKEGTLPLARGVKLLYRNDRVTSDELQDVARARQDVNGPAQARGLCSRVFCLDGVTARFTRAVCLKRVMEDDQAPPHSVEREVRCYELLWNHATGDEPLGIIPLLAAFYDESDPFDVLTDLVMPFHPCTLQDLLDEPAMQVSHADEGGVVGIDDGDPARPSLAVLRQIDDVPAFVLRTFHTLFAALRFLHSHGVAHRDVKPSNVVVDEQDGAIRLIDFGTCQLPRRTYPKADDGHGGIASEVGTGAYRAPECLFSPLKGYDADKVDIWQAGATLAEFFLPLKRVRSSKSQFEGRAQPKTDVLDWERALWSNDDGAGWSALRGQPGKIDGHAPTFYGGEGQDGSDDEEPALPVTASGWQRDQLFDGTRSDLGLANSIFTLLGLPKGDEEGAKQWPEAAHFQPPLVSMPFARRPPATEGLHSRLDVCGHPPNLLDVLTQCIRLSASERITAEDAVRILEKQ